jgi:hypothetical protein
MHQTWILVKLHSNRFILKSRLKWLLVAIFVLNIALFVLSKLGMSRFRASPSPPVQVTKVPVLFLDDSAVPSLNATTRFGPEFSVVRLSKQEYLTQIKAMNRTIPFFIEMHGMRAYSVHSALVQMSFTKIFECLGVNCLLFHLPQMAVTLARFDALLKGETHPPLVLLDEKTITGTFFADFFLDPMYFVLASMVTSGLLEDRIKGIQFGLFMTGVRRSSYYIGILSIPFGISLAYCLMHWVFLDQLSPSPTAFPVTGMFFLLTATAFPVWFWFVSQVSKNTKVATVLNLLFIILGLVATVPDIQDFFFYQAPTWLSVLLCVNPRFAFKMYQRMITVSPLGPGFSNTPIFVGFLSGNL